MAKYFKNIWLGIYTVLVGMSLTLKHLFYRNVTIQYPDERYPIPDNARNRLYVDPDLCTGCKACERICPVQCIEIDTIKGVPGKVPPTKNGQKRALWVAKFDIDFSKCCFCGFCTEPCPTGAIYHTTEFEYSSSSREELKYTFIEMTPEEIEEKKKELAQFQAEKKKKAEAAAKAKKAAEEKGGADGKNEAK